MTGDCVSKFRLSVSFQNLSVWKIHCLSPAYCFFESYILDKVRFDQQSFSTLTLSGNWVDWVYQQFVIYVLFIYSLIYGVLPAQICSLHVAKSTESTIYWQRVMQVWKTQDPNFSGAFRHFVNCCYIQLFCAHVACLFASLLLCKICTGPRVCLTSLNAACKPSPLMLFE